MGRRVATANVASDRGLRPGFGGAAGWTVLGTILPGLGFLRAGRKVLGSILLGITVLGVGALATFAIVDPAGLKQAVLNPTVLYGAAAALLVLALGWVLIITTTHLSLRPRPATVPQRILGGALVGVLAFAVAGPMAFGANVVYASAGALGIFEAGDGTTANPTDPWKGQKRLNILLLGGDSGTKSHRSLAVGSRTDTVIVASIDTHTGAATLITLPRNATKMPFPPNSPLRKHYPNGFTDTSNILNAEYLLNAMYRNVPAQVPNNLLGKTKDFGASVMMQSVGYALGLKIDYYAFVNMDGFKDFINAIGGITVNVNYRIPVGGHNASGNQPAQAPESWIEVGPNKHLSGGYALWYARGRYQLNDYSRMERQRCVINAVVKQADPANILLNFQAIATTGEKNISTNLPRDLLPSMVDLAMKTKNTKVRSLVFDPSNGFYSWKPDWNKVRSQVQKALDTTTANAEVSPSASGSPVPGSTAPSSGGSTAAAPTGGSTSTAPTGSSTPSATTKSKDKSDDLDDACAYNPKKYTGK